MLATRLATSVLMVALFVLILWVDGALAPWYPCWFVFSVLALGFASSEVAALLQRTSASPSASAVVGGVLALVVSNWAPHLIDAFQNAASYHREIEGLNPLGYDPNAPIHWLAWPLWTFVGVLMYAFIAQSAQFDKPGGTMAAIAGTLLAVSYVGLLGSFIIQMRWIGGPGEGVVLIACLFATAKGADVGAYTLGRIAGRHKLWPRLSPNKTIEGAIGGMVFGVVGALLVVAIARELFDVATISWTGALGFGVLVGAAAQLGDLMESMIKRDCASKDSSAAVPGFGGLLDVADSLLFAGPIAYGYWLLVRP